MRDLTSADRAQRAEDNLRRAGEHLADLSHSLRSAASRAARPVRRTRRQHR